jgi:alpha-glucosidase (family GH31 glycosyl hydrolase)
MLKSVSSVAISGVRLTGRLEDGREVSIAVSVPVEGVLRLRAADEAVPIMRPMMLAYPGARAARDADLQYLFGPDLLVAPVLERGGARQVWVPPGPSQHECGHAAVTGPSWVAVRCELEQFPVWRKS